MNKYRKCKKIVQNSKKLPLPPVIIEEIPEIVYPPSTLSTVGPTPQVSDSEQDANLGSPRLNTLMCLEKRIRAYEKKHIPHKFKVNKGVLVEKITKQVNFPFDKVLYKKLISLNLLDEHYSGPNTPSSSVPEALLNDRKPKLKDFFAPPEVVLEYDIPVTNIIGPTRPRGKYDGLRLHKRKESWKK